MVTVSQLTTMELPTHVAYLNPLIAIFARQLGFLKIENITDLLGGSQGENK